MSNQGYYDDQSQNNPQHPHTNPWADATTQNTQQAQYQQPQLPPDPWQQQGEQQQQHYNAPSGAPPPPGPGQAPRRADTFEEIDFVPENERGEQREAMEQFELNKSGNEDQRDKDVAQLQEEFPGLDGSLIAALYSDNGNMGATREMLQELAGQGQAGQ